MIFMIILYENTSLKASFNKYGHSSNGKTEMSLLGLHTKGSLIRKKRRIVYNNSIIILYSLLQMAYKK